MRSSECDVLSLYVLCCSVNGSVCFVCCVFDSVCELFGETIRNMFVILLLNVMELLSVVWRCSIGYTMYGLPMYVCVVPVVPSERLDAPFICFVYVFVCRKLSPHLGV